MSRHEKDICELSGIEFTSVETRSDSGVCEYGAGIKIPVMAAVMKVRAMMNKLSSKRNLDYKMLR